MNITRHRARRIRGFTLIDANIAHPAEYADVGHALVAQNLLVVRGSEASPRDGTAQ